MNNLSGVWSKANETKLDLFPKLGLKWLLGIVPGSLVEQEITRTRWEET